MRPKSKTRQLIGRDDTTLMQPPRNRGRVLAQNTPEGRALLETSVAERNVQKARPSKILVLDIESSPLEVYVWSLWVENIGLDFIKTEWTILSYAAKWLGDSKIMYADTGGRGADKVRDDRLLMGDIWDLVNQADIIVAQNGARFDMRKIRARLIMHGFLPPSNTKVVDTLLESRKHFGFTSQKLAWTSKYLTNSPKSEHKKFPGFELWKECLADNPAAWAEMKKYNRQDVIATEKVYLAIRPWIKTHPNIAEGAGRCPVCTTGQVVAIGRHTQSSGIVYERLWCKKCGHWSRGKQMLLPLAERQQMSVSIT